MYSGTVTAGIHADVRPEGRIDGVPAWCVGALLFSFFVSTLVVPSAAINKLVFGILLLVAFLTPFVFQGRAPIRTVSPLMILCVFVYGYVISIAGVVDSELGNQLVLSVAVLMLIYLLDWYKIDVDTLVKLAGIALCLFTAVFFYLVVVMDGSALAVYFMDNFREYSLGSLGQRDVVNGSAFMFRMGTTPFLYLPFSLFWLSFLDRRRWIDLTGVLATGFVMVVSTSRGLVLSAVLVVCFTLVTRLGVRARVVAACAVSVLAALAAFYLVENTRIFSASEASNSIKLGHIVSFVDNLTPRGLLTGEGLGAYYFSSGRNAFISQTEITPLDMIRYVGLPMALVFYFSLIWPALKLSSYRGSRGVYAVLFLLYLALSTTNPVLVNSYGFLVVIWYWAKVLLVDERSRPGAPIRREGA